MDDTSQESEAIGAELIDLFKQRMQAAGVHTVIAQFVDIHGSPKGKYIPLAHLEDILGAGAGFAGPSIWGTGLPRTGPRAEFYGKGDLTTLQALPWMPGYARIVCSGMVDNKPFSGCSRRVLLKQIERLNALGWTLNVGIEPEFFLVTQDENGRPIPCDKDNQDKPSYDLKALARVRDVLHKMETGLTACGFDVFQIDHEDASSQYELNYHYSDALQAADRFTLFKMAASHIAEEAGLIFTLMPKPFADRPGSGLHLHLSLTDKDGEAVMADTTEPHGLSLIGRQVAAGLLAHSAALAAFHAPSVNSYKRLVIGRSLSGTTWAPAHIGWGYNNRTTVLRTVANRLEFRLTDGTTNIYLALASCIAAMLDGVERELKPPKPIDEDVYAWDADEFLKQEVKSLPQTLGEAIAALHADNALAIALGEDFVAEYLAIKQPEWIDYCRSVSDWEYRRYLAT